MSFIQSEPLNATYQPGWFLESADCVRKTVQVNQNHAQVKTKADGSKYVPAGAVVPANDATAKGLLYEDVDVSTGNMPGSLVTEGRVYVNRLPAAPVSAAKTAMSGITFIDTEPTVTRPNSFDKSDLDTITVSSTAGSGAGKTDVAVSGYTLGTGERYVYKVGSDVVSVAVGEILSIGSSDGQWTSATFPLDELTATPGQKITVVAVDGTNAAVAAGNATITSKAA